jgi:hypothetical protein
VSRFRRDDGLSDLEARLRAARPEPRADLLTRLQAQAEPRPATTHRRSRLRLGLAAGFAASFVALFAAIGGLGLTSEQSTAAATPTTGTTDTLATAPDTSAATGGTVSAPVTGATGTTTPSAPATQDGSTSTPVTGATAPAVGGDASAEPSRQLATGWHNQYVGWTVVCKKVGRVWAVLIVPRWQLSYWTSKGWTTSCFRR